jgi:hypothetical protein
MINREAAYGALFNLILELDGIPTCSRILAHWDDVSPSQQPAIFLAQDTQLATQTKGMPSIYLLGAKLWIYAHRDTNEVVPSSQINNILDAIDGVLMPSPSPDYKQTLGGVVQHCWINGAIETDEGTLGNQSVAIVPITMQVTT